MTDDREVASRPHVLYRLYGPDDGLLYVGITARFKKRMTEHRAGQPWFHLVARTEVAQFDDRATASLAEIEAIQAETPAFNRAWTDGRQPRALRPATPAADNQPRDEVLAELGKASAARRRAERTLAERERAEERLIQDAYEELGPGYGRISTIVDTTKRSREHVRKVLDSTNKRGHYADTSSP